MVSRTRNTQLLAIVSSLNLLISSVFSIIIGRIILAYLGSEYNGINAIVAQFLMIISVLEGGFTTASIVAMMHPYEAGKQDEIDQIFAETSIKFRRITALYLTFGAIGAIGYGLIIRTNIQAVIVIAVLIIGVIGSAFNVGVVSKYRLIFQVAQKEHIYAAIMLCFTTIGQIGMIVSLVITQNIVFMRFIGMICSITGGAVVIGVFSKRFNIKRVKWDKITRIKGTRDVIVGKVVGTIHSSATTLFLSIFSGAALTSVYAVYNSVIHMITSVVNIGFSSPQNAIGQVLQGENHQNKRTVIFDYQYVIIVALTALFVPLSVLIVPFVRIYTQGITDAQYINYGLATLLIISTYFQLLHVPSGICVYMSGGFKAAKKIQLLALAILVISNLLLGKLLVLYGFLISTILCNLFLALCEIIYVHTKLIPRSGGSFLKFWIPNLLLMVALIAICNYFSYVVTDVLSWIVSACIVTVISIVITIVFNKLFMKEQFERIQNRLLKVIKTRKNSVQ